MTPVPPRGTKRRPAKKLDHEASISSSSTVAAQPNLFNTDNIVKYDKSHLPEVVLADLAIGPIFKHILTKWSPWTP